MQDITFRSFLSLSVQEAAKAARLRASGAAKAAADGAFVDGAGEEEPLVLEAAKADDAEAAEKDYLEDLRKEMRQAGADKAGEEEEEEEGEEAEEKAEERPAKKRAKNAAAAAEAEREKMKDIMMTRKNRKLYERIKRSQEGKRDRVEALETKKRALANSKDEGSGKSKARGGPR